MRKVIYLILIGISWSCNSHKEIEKDGIIFRYTNQVTEQLADSISDYFIQEKQQNKWIGLDKVKQVKIDSAYYSYLLYINCSDMDSLLVSERRKGRMQAFAKMLSDDIVDSSAVHVFLTDDAFKVKEGLPFNPKIIKTIDSYYIAVRDKTKIQVKGEFITNLTEGLFEEFSVNKPELFKSKDTLEININKNTSNVEVNIFINPKAVNLNTLETQFKKSDPIIYNILFSGNTTYFNIIDKGSKENIKVFKHQGTSKN